MKILTKATTVFVALMGALTVTAAIAANHHGGKRGMHAGGMGGERMIEMMAQKLELSDEQKDQMRAIHDEIRPQLRTLREELWESRKALREAVNNGASQEEIEQMAAAQGNLHSEMIVLHAQIQRRIGDILTEEQRLRADELHDQMKERRHHRRGGRRDDDVDESDDDRV